LNDDAHKSVAEITFLDVGLSSSLIFQNTRTGRVLPGLPQALLGVWESLPPTGATSFADADPQFVTSDDFGKVYVRRRALGMPSVETDGSVGIRIRGGAPITLEVLAALAGETVPTSHMQREEMQFYPARSRAKASDATSSTACAAAATARSAAKRTRSPSPGHLDPSLDVKARGKEVQDFSQTVTGDVGP